MIVYIMKICVCVCVSVAPTTHHKKRKVPKYLKILAVDLG